ncbi:hypothetical protein BH24ACT5_BH24ACT5_27560 [soil metagenome]
MSYIPLVPPRLSRTKHETLDVRRKRSTIKLFYIATAFPGFGYLGPF